MKKVVFFDVDETILNCKSMFSFLKFFLENKVQKNEPHDFDTYFKKIRDKVNLGLPREELNIFFYRYWKGFKQKEILDLSRKWYLENKKSEDFFISKNIELLKNKKQEGFKIIAVSGSAFDILHDFIKELEFDDSFFSQPEVKNGIYTGALLNDPMIGKFKAEAILKYMKEEKIDPKSCFAVADHESDIPMLKCVGTGYLFKDNDYFLV